MLCARTAAAGHLNCLRYAHENGWPWDGETLNAARENRHVLCLRYARDHGCPVDEDGPPPVTPRPVTPREQGNSKDNDEEDEDDEDMFRIRRC